MCIIKGGGRLSKPGTGGMEEGRINFSLQNTANFMIVIVFIPSAWVRQQFDNYLMLLGLVTFLSAVM